ncbi:hypothetical protein GS531_00250 [Rhodococcus hoagii]|nr:hypothetical protein [Prescottella equi]
MGADARESTAAVLERMCGSGGTLDRNGATSSHRLHVNDPHRRRTIDRIVDSYLAEQDDVVVGGQFCAIATAGVPGAGKSTSIKKNGLAGRGWRVLDADRVKDYLIRDALGSGVYRDILAMVLPDGGTLRPRELATLVHLESTKIVDELQELCMKRGENIVVEGTFSWPGLGERLLRQLGAAGYERFTIMDVEVSRERAKSKPCSGGGTAARTRPMSSVADSPPPPSSRPCTRPRDPHRSARRTRARRSITR